MPGAARECCVRRRQSAPGLQRQREGACLSLDRCSVSPNLIDARGEGELYSVPYVASQWSVFDGNGRWVTDIEMPAGFLVMDVGVDYVLGLQFRLKDGTPRGPAEVTMYGYRRTQTR
jgi:hypothetical protein